MDSNWLVQGLLTNWVSELLILLATAIVTYLRKKNSSWLSPVLYGLGGGALVAAILFFGISAARQGQAIVPDSVTPDTIESDITQWANNSRLAIQKVDDKDAYFGYNITLPFNAKVNVFRPKGSLDNMVTFRVILIINSMDQAEMEKLTPRQKLQIYEQVDLELARLQIEHVEIGSSTVPVQRVEIERSVVIKNMTPADFSSALGALVSAQEVVQQAINLKISEFGTSTTR